MTKRTTGVTLFFYGVKIWYMRAGEAPDLKKYIPGGSLFHEIYIRIHKERGPGLVCTNRVKLPPLLRKYMEHV